MDREALVYVDLDGVPHLMGRLWARTRKNKESATFEYDKTWLENPARFSLEPALQVGPGPFHAPADSPCSGPSATPRPIVDGARSCAAWSKRAERDGRDVAHAPARRRAKRCGGGWFST